VNVWILQIKIHSLQLVERKPEQVLKEAVWGSVGDASIERGSVGDASIERGSVGDASNDSNESIGGLTIHRQTS